MTVPSGSRGKALKRYHWIWLPAIVLLCYSNTLSGPFVFDDLPNIVENPIIRDLRHFWQPQSLSEIRVSSGHLHGFRTRYLAYLTLALNYRVHGLHVAGYHALNLAIHVVASLLVFQIVRRILELPALATSRLRGEAPAIAFFCAALFACHPIQTQAVTYVVQRMASLCAMFCLLGLYGYLVSWAGPVSSLRTRLSFAGALLSLAAAMLTKQNAFVFPLVLVLVDLLFLDGRPRLRAWRLAPVLATAMLVPLTAAGSARIHDALIGLATARAPGAPDVSSLDYFLTQQRVIVSYLRLLLVPIGQNADHHVRLSRSLWEPTVLLSALVLAALIAGAAALIWRGFRGEPGLRLAGFGALWFFIALSVESGIVPIEDVMVEHRLYLPSVGFFLSVVTGLFLLATGRTRLLRAVLWTAVIALAAATWARNQVWADPVRFWSDVAAKSPANSRALNNLGNLASLRGAAGEALGYYQRAILADPRNFEPRYNAGALQWRLGRTSEAITLLGEAIPLDVYKWRARAKLEEIAKTETRKISAGFDTGPAHVRLGIIWQALGERKRAAAEFSKAQQYPISRAPALERLGQLLLEELKPLAARHMFESVLADDPANLTARRGLADALAAEGLLREALVEYRTVLAGLPDDPEIWAAAARAYERAGEAPKSAAYARRAAQLRANPPPESHSSR